MTEKLFSQEAEQSVIGGIFVSPVSFEEVLERVNVNDFSNANHRLIFKAMIYLQQQQTPIDILTVSELLEERGHLNTGGDQQGGVSMAYLLTIAQDTPSAANVLSYAGIVRNYSQRRKLTQLAASLATWAQQERDCSVVMARCRDALDGINTGKTVDGPVLIKELMTQMLGDMIEKSEQPTLRGMSTGFPDLDRLTDGLKPGKLYVIAGRPGMGKSVMGINLLHHTVKQGQSALLFTLEMDNSEVLQRLCATEQGLDSYRLQRAKMSDDEWAQLCTAAKDLSEHQWWIDETPGLTITDLVARARRLHRCQPLSILAVDYIGLIRTARQDRRDLEISEITRSLKELSKELSIPVIALSQLNRDLEKRPDKRPLMSDLRESGCLAGDTMIYRPDTGRYIPIRDLAGQSDFPVLSINQQTWKLELATVSRAFCTGKRKVYRITTRLGRTIRATANHPFLTFKGWRRLDELTDSTRIALPRSIESSFSQTMSDAELALLGHMIGDGCTLPRHAIQYTTGKKDLAEKVVSFALEIFGNTIKPRIQRERTWYQVYLAAAHRLARGSRNPVAEWLDRLKVFGLRSYQKRVPALVFQQPPKAIGLFLKNLWATDGCIIQGNGEKVYASVYYATSSEGLARDIQSLLLRLGINATLKRRSEKKGRDQYHVIITGKPDLTAFINQIGAIGDHQSQQMAVISNHLLCRKANTNRDIIPADIWRSLAVPYMQQLGITTRKMQSRIGHAYCGTGLYRQNVSRDRAKRLADAVESDEITRLAQSDVYWDEVAFIEDDGEDEVFDLTVPGLHNFVANDILVHNSVEQDADVVIMLYRDDQYNDQSIDKDCAEVLIRKNRSGRCGMIPLRFEGHRYRFLPLPEGLPSGANPSYNGNGNGRRKGFDG